MHACKCIRKLRRNKGRVWEEKEEEEEGEGGGKEEENNIYIYIYVCKTIKTAIYTYLLLYTLNNREKKCSHQ